MKSFKEKVYAVVRKIPRGKVASYGQVAYLAGFPRAARAVGGALHMNPDSPATPCHRVVNAAGRVAPGFAFGGPKEQAKMLRREGVIVSDAGYVNMDPFGWKPKI